MLLTLHYTMTKEALASDEVESLSICFYPDHANALSTRCSKWLFDIILTPNPQAFITFPLSLSLRCNSEKTDSEILSVGLEWIL